MVVRLDRVVELCIAAHAGLKHREDSDTRRLPLVRDVQVPINTLSRADIMFCFSLAPPRRGGVEDALAKRICQSNGRARAEVATPCLDVLEALILEALSSGCHDSISNAISAWVGVSAFSWGLSRVGPASGLILHAQSPVPTAGI